MPIISPPVLYQTHQNSLMALGRALDNAIREQLGATMKIAELLTANRINWNLIIELGGSIELIAHEARQHGDSVLYRRAVSAMARRKQA